VSVNFHPLHDRVLIRRLPADEKIGGLYIPEAAKEKPISGTVLAIGPGRLTAAHVLLPPTVTVGDVVIFGKYVGDEVRIDGEDLIIAHESDLLAIVGDL
jgi:chaperonin GroES